MDEIGFVIKSFIVSAFAVFLLQMKVRGESVEHRVVSYMQNAWATQWMKDMGKGATRATASVYDQTIGPIVKQQSKTLGKMADIKSELKAVEEQQKKHEQELMEIEDR
jgi:hypothetical protein